MYLVNLPIADGPIALRSSIKVVFKSVRESHSFWPNCVKFCSRKIGIFFSCFPSASSVSKLNLKIYHNSIRDKIDLHFRKKVFLKSRLACTVKLGNKERFDKEQIGIKEPFPVTSLPFTS